MYMQKLKYKLIKIAAKELDRHLNLISAYNYNIYLDFKNKKFV